MTSTDICNMAVSYLGRGRINSLQEDSEESRQCNIHYDHVRRRLLHIFPWGFARRMEKLAERTDNVPGWKCCYGYPSECLHVLFVFDEEHASRRQEQREDFDVLTMRAGTRILCSNVDDAWAEFICDAKDPASFSEEFSDALAHMLAASLALQLDGSTSLQQVQLQLATDNIERAKYFATIENERRLRYPRHYMEARNQ